MTRRWWISTLTLITIAPIAFSHLAGCGGDDATQALGDDGGGDATGDGGGNGDGAGGDGTLGDGAGGDSTSSGDGAGGDGSSGDGSSGDSSASDGGVGDGASCVMTGQTCAADGECCTASCDMQMHICSRPIGVCKVAGDTCSTGNECCTFVCSSGHCGAQLCISDNQPCTSSASCCGGACGAGGGDGGSTCTPLNPSCRTAGNACQVNGDCCASLCTNGRCSGQVSFCTQTGDVCSTNAECCGGLCTKQGTNTLGVCGVPQVTGTPQCTIAGELCGAGTDGGTLPDSGIPTCGGSCCSRACAPYGQTRALICEPPSGCRPTGELCRNDNDCCGAPGTPTGGANSDVHCAKQNSSDPVGRCDNGNRCSPAGAICRLATNSCNATDRCCAGTVQTHPYLCKQDIVGIPRCTITGVCPDAGSLQGQPCASSADCCGLVCAPNPNAGDAGAPFVCGASCVSQCGACTTTADCCPGIACVLPPGSSSGTCGTSCGTTDGGTTSDGGTAGDSSTPTDAGVCTLYGQLCSMSGECCDGVPCTNGRCVFPIP